MVGLLDIEGIRVVLGGVWYEAEEVAVGTNFDVVWPQRSQGQPAIQSIGLDMPYGFTVQNSPLTQSGTFTVRYDSAYGLPTLAAQAAWNLLVEAFTVAKSGNAITNIRANANLSVVGDVAASGNVTAGTVGVDSGLTNYILYRLDSWTSYDDSDQDMWGWVPSAHIVYQRFLGIDSQINALWDAIDDIEGGGGSGSGSGGSSLLYYLEMPEDEFTVTYVRDSVDQMTIKVELQDGYVIPTEEQLESSAFFDAIKYSDVIVGAKALYDISIIQSSSGGVDTLKNISELLRHLTYNPAVPQTSAANITADIDIISAGNIVAGSVGVDSGLSNMILYRLDSWSSYDSTKADWVPSAAIVEQRFSAIEGVISSGSEVEWGTEVTDLSVVLSVDSVPKTLALAAGYVQKSVFEAIFNVQPSSVSLLTVDAQTPRNFNVPGSIVATGNITAGAVGIDSGISNYILYRLDSWTGYTELEKGDWVPSAALVDQLRQTIISGGYDDTDLWDEIALIEDMDTTQNTRLQTLEGLPKIKYVGAGTPYADYPVDSEMEEGTLYVKLSQTSS